MTATSTFVWGLKRSGLHLIANWLFANHGGTVRGELASEGLHPRLDDGFVDRRAGVAFYNNPGRFHCRQFELGDIEAHDFELAASRHAATVFTIEDCALRFASKTPRGAHVASVLVLRDPLNNIASRLQAARTRPEQFRVDRQYIDLYEGYCEEFLGRSDHLANTTVVSFNRFVDDRPYRDAVAIDLGLTNVDDVSEVSEYGGGSSFSGLSGPGSISSLSTRFHQHPVPGELVELLLDRPAIREVCAMVFGFDLAERAGVG